MDMPELRLVANGAQIDSLLGKIEKLKRYDLSIAPKEKRVLLDEVLGLVMEHFLHDWYSTALQTLREGWERQKRSEIHYDHFVSLMKDYNEPFLRRSSSCEVDVSRECTSELRKKRLASTIQNFCGRSRPASHPSQVAAKWAGRWPSMGIRKR